MSWHVFTDKATGEIVSDGSVIPDDLDTDTYDIVTLPDRPDWDVQDWDAGSQTVVDRPAPVMVDRLDDIQARFLADPDFAAVWSSLTPARRTQLRTGILHVLGSILGGFRYRRDDEREEVG